MSTAVARECPSRSSGWDPVISQLVPNKTVSLGGRKIHLYKFAQPPGSQTVLYLFGDLIGDVCHDVQQKARQHFSSRAGSVCVVDSKEALDRAVQAWKSNLDQPINLEQLRSCSVFRQCF